MGTFVFFTSVTPPIEQATCQAHSWRSEPRRASGPPRGALSKALALPKAGCSVPSLADLHAVTSQSPRGMSPGIRTQWLTEQGAPPGAGPTLGLPRATSLGRTEVFSRIPELIWKPVFSNSAPKQLEGFFSPCWIQSTSF